MSLGGSLPGSATRRRRWHEDASDDRDDVEPGCSMDGQPLRQGSSRDLLPFGPPLIGTLSRKLSLLPVEGPARWVTGISELRQRGVRGRRLLTSRPPQARERGGRR